MSVPVKIALQKCLKAHGIDTVLEFLEERVSLLGSMKLKDLISSQRESSSPPLLRGKCTQAY